MFVHNHINIPKKTLRELFAIVDEDGSGELGLDEFKKFIMNDDAIKSKFKELNSPSHQDSEKLFRILELPRKLRSKKKPKMLN